MINTQSSDDSIDYIRQRLTDDAEFLALLLQSLGAASAAGRAQFGEKLTDCFERYVEPEHRGHLAVGSDRRP